MRLVSWNIRAGGGVRAQRIVDQLVSWAPDVVALSEFRGTEPSAHIAAELSKAGLKFQRCTADPAAPAVNSLLVASRYELRTVNLRRAPANPRRWLHVTVAAPRPFAVIAVHIPNRVTGTKYPFMDSVIDVVSHWRGRSAIIMGDTNSGQIGLDEESPAFNKIEDNWLQRMNQLCWCDVFRLLYPDKLEYTWYSPNGRNGFRLDQMYAHPQLAAEITAFRHQWGGHAWFPAQPDDGERTGISVDDPVMPATMMNHCEADEPRREILSDHAAMIVDLSGS